jgi:hypothetical protein
MRLKMAARAKTRASKEAATATVAPEVVAAPAEPETVVAPKVAPTATKKVAAKKRTSVYDAPKTSVEVGVIKQKTSKKLPEPAKKQ